MSFEESPHEYYTTETTQSGLSEQTSVSVERNTSEQLVLDVDLDNLPILTKEEKIEIAYEQTKRDEALLKLGYDDPVMQETELTTAGKLSRDSSFIVHQAGNVYRQIKRAWQQLQDDAVAEDAVTNRVLLQLLARIFESTDTEEMIKVAAFIATKNTIAGTQIGLASTPPERTTVRKIGQEVAFEAFSRFLKEVHPRLLSIISKYQLSDQVKGTAKRIKLSYQKASEYSAGTLEWQQLTDKEHIRIGEFLATCVYDGCYVEDKEHLNPQGEPYRHFVFETINVPMSKTRREKAIVLTKQGEQLLEELVEFNFSKVYANPPMLFPPKPWVNGCGGYYTKQPEPLSQMVHNSAGTRPSETAIKALNNLQSIAWQVNTYIFNVLVELSKEQIEVGSFRSHNSEAYKLLTDPILNPEDEELQWDNSLLTDDEVLRRNRAYAIRKQWEDDEEMNKRKAMSPARVLSTTAQLLEDLEDYGLDCFYVPWFMDNRTRMYPAVDTLSPQGSDYQKALMLFKRGTKKSDESYHDILVSIGTTFGNGIDKLSFEGRKNWAKKFLAKLSGDFHPVVSMVEDPISEAHRELWFAAEEPFQFLALCKEYVDVFIKGIQDTHHVSGGRDATCSGIQITGALLRDERTCELVNVLPGPTDEPQDAYGAVAAEAIKLLTNDDWLLQRVTKREENRKLAAEREIKAFEQDENPIEELRPRPYEPRSFEETKAALPLDHIDRSVAKMVVMLTPYGGSYRTMLGHVTEKLKKKGVKIHYSDYSIITHALIEGMTIALRAFSEVNAWFKTLAKATIDSSRPDSNLVIQWLTPNGSQVIQEYYKDDADQVSTATRQTGVVRTYASKRTNYDKLNKSKMQTALAANVVHSLDANIIQDAIADYKKTAFTAVHDCIYGPSGALGPLTDRIKEAFYATTVKANPLATIVELNLPDEQSRETLPVLQYGKAKITKAALKKSHYLFS